MTTNIFSVWYYFFLVFFMASMDTVFGVVSGKVAVALGGGALFLAACLTIEAWWENRKGTNGRHGRLHEEEVP